MKFGGDLYQVDLHDCFSNILFAEVGNRQFLFLVHLFPFHKLQIPDSWEERERLGEQWRPKIKMRRSCHSRKVVLSSCRNIWLHFGTHSHRFNSVYSIIRFRFDHFAGQHLIDRLVHDLNIYRMTVWRLVCATEQLVNGWLIEYKWLAERNRIMNYLGTHVWNVNNATTHNQTIDTHVHEPIRTCMLKRKCLVWFCAANFIESDRMGDVCDDFNCNCLALSGDCVSVNLEMSVIGRIDIRIECRNNHGRVLSECEGVNWVKWTAHVSLLQMHFHDFKWNCMQTIQSATQAAMR